MCINYGIDWAEVHHDVALVDENGTVVAWKRIDTGTAGLTALLEVIAESGGAPGTTHIAIETDKNLLVVVLVEAGFTVYPIIPGRWPATANVTVRPAVSPIRGTPRFWRIFCALTERCTVRWR